MNSDKTNGLPNAGDDSGDHDAHPNEGDGEGPSHENDTVDGTKESEIEIAEKPTKKRKARKIKGTVMEQSGGSKPEKKLEKKLEKKPVEKKPANGQKRKAESEVTAEDVEKSEVKKAVRSKGLVPKTFARRNRPSTEGGALKWDALQQVFSERIKPAVVAFSAHQDWVGLTAFLFGLSKIGGLDELYFGFLGSRVLGMAVFFSSSHIHFKNSRDLEGKR